jgi:hypothetical protein
MSRRFKRPLHEAVARHLARLDASFLAECRCYFGGGTRIVLELDEYRESKDIDFLCADQDGYRKLRETVSEQSLGRIAQEHVDLAREVRADMYGIRTRLGQDDSALKFEIVREARIALIDARIKGIEVPGLSHSSAFAEKFLANADRGLDRSTLSRDAIDLAFMIESWSAEDASSGYAMAIDAYGADVARKLAAVLGSLKDRPYRARCVEGLGISDTTTLARGLKRVAAFVAANP